VIEHQERAPGEGKMRERLALAAYLPVDHALLKPNLSSSHPSTAFGAEHPRQVTRLARVNGCMVQLNWWGIVSFRINRRGFVSKSRLDVPKL
jgi:hypothetical protein